MEKKQLPTAPKEHVFPSMSSHPPLLFLGINSSSPEKDQVVKVVDMDPDIDEFNEDVEIPKDLDCPVLPRRASVWGGRIGRSGISAIFMVFGEGESGEVVFGVYSWYIDVDGLCV